MTYPTKTDCAELKGFCKAYGRGASRILACHDVDLCARQGCITGLLGPNGAGKTTVLKALCGIHYGTGGTVQVCGMQDALSIRRIAGYVPEIPLSVPGVTVKEALYDAARLRGVAASDVRSAVARVAAFCAVEDIAGRKMATLSKGFAQRVSLAMALLGGVRLLVLDEFSAGLDPVQTVRIRALVRELSKTKIVILSTHRIEEAAALCDYLYILSHGTCVADGSAADIMARTHTQALEAAFLRVTQEQDL